MGQEIVGVQAGSIAQGKSRREMFATIVKSCLNRRMKMYLMNSWALPLVATLVSCGNFQKEEVESVVERAAGPIGRIDKVNAAAGYVFIRRYGKWQLDDEDILVTKGATDGVERTANLLATGEKLGEHIAADIRSGDVKVGDAVFAREISATDEGASDNTKFDLDGELGSLVTEGATEAF